MDPLLALITVPLLASRASELVLAIFGPRTLGAFTH